MSELGEKKQKMCAKSKLPVTDIPEGQLDEK